MSKRLNLAILKCHTQAHCRTCRTDADWRENVTGHREFECPHGITEKNLPSRGLGDTIAKITSAIGIKPCGGCKKRQESLNRLAPYSAGSHDSER